MSFPREPDFAVIKIGDGGSPEQFTILCGMDTANINQTVNTNDTFRRDCAKPGSTPKRKVRITGTQWDVTGSGVVNMSQIPLFNSVLGISKSYRIEFGQRDGTDVGVIVGYYQGPAVMTAYNKSVSEDGTAEITLAGEDDIIWTEIVPDVPVATITAPTASVAEGSGSPTIVLFDLEIDMAAPTGGLSVNWTLGGTMSAADFTGGVLPAGPTVIPEGDSSVEISMSVAGDTDIETDETIIVTLAAGSGYVVGSPNSATVTVTNDDE